MTYLRYKYQTEDGSCTNEEAQTEESGINIEVFLKSVEWEDGHSCDNTSHVYSNNNAYGVIEALDLDLAYWEWECKSEHLQECFVAR